MGALSLTALLSVFLVQMSAPARGDVAAGISAYEAGDFDAALLEFRAGVAGGSTDAMCYLGLMYSRGQGVPADPSRAVRWFRQAAEGGHVEAQYQLGMALQDDLAGAFHWFKAAAEAGHPSAAFSLGSFYEMGIGTERDSFAALHWYMIAARGQVAEAMHSIGSLYLIGRGMGQDPVAAAKWFWLAGQRGDEMAHRLALSLRQHMSTDEWARARALAESWQ